MLNDNNPFKLVGLEFKGGVVTVDYSVITDTGVQEQGVEFSLVYNSIPEDEVALLRENLDRFSLVAAYLDTLATPSVIREMITTFGGDLPFDAMTNFEENLAQLEIAENRYDSAVPYFSVFAPVVGNFHIVSFKLDSFQQGSIEIMAEKTLVHGRTVKVKFPSVSLTDHLPQSRRETAVPFYQAVGKWITSIESIVQRWVSDALNTTQKQMDLFYSGELTDQWKTFANGFGGHASDDDFDLVDENTSQRDPHSLPQF